MDNKARARVIISGRVQDVFFRLETKRFADSMGVTGWVKNNRDGSVEAVFEGDEERVKKAVEWCRKGPPLSKVTDLKLMMENFSGDYSSFEVTY